jgi:hypothetical protein
MMFITYSHNRSTYRESHVTGSRLPSSLPGSCWQLHLPIHHSDVHSRSAPSIPVLWASIPLAKKPRALTARLVQHAMDKNCCGGGEACGFVYCLGQDQCTQPWMVDDFVTECAPGESPELGPEWAYACHKLCAACISTSLPTSPLQYRLSTVPCLTCFRSTRRRQDFGGLRWPPHPDARRQWRHDGRRPPPRRRPGGRARLHRQRRLPVVRYPPVLLASSLVLFHILLCSSSLSLLAMPFVPCSFLSCPTTFLLPLSSSFLLSSCMAWW